MREWAGLLEGHPAVPLAADMRHAIRRTDRHARTAAVLHHPKLGIGPGALGVRHDRRPRRPVAQDDDRPASAGGQARRAMLVIHRRGLREVRGQSPDRQEPGGPSICSACQAVPSLCPYRRQLWVSFVETTWPLLTMSQLPPVTSGPGAMTELEASGAATTLKWNAPSTVFPDTVSMVTDRDAVPVAGSFQVTRSSESSRVPRWRSGARA